MSKFRSKLKRSKSGAKWARGQSATSNPESKKHRNAAQSRFFQPNLLNTDAKKSTTNGITSLTVESVSKHDVRQLYAGGNKPTKSIVLTKSVPTVHDIAMSLHSFSMSEGDDDQSYARSFQTFGSRYSSCTNMTFNKFLNRFQQSSDLHKEMLAILSAITEVIKERNGTQSSAEFFLGLMETLEATKEEKGVIATLSLLTMVMKSVPQPVLRRKFADTGEIFLQLLEQFADSENQNVLRSIIGCISVLLRAQEYTLWSVGLTLKLFNQVLSFVIHTKPNIRRAAQRAIVSTIHGSCFMSTQIDSIEDGQKPNDIIRIQYHPAGSYAAKFCIEQFKVENMTKSQNVVLYVIELLKSTLSGFKNDDIKEICEYLFPIMATSKTNVQKNCFDTLHHLFESKSPNLSQDLILKLLAAIYDYRPEPTDMNLTLAWLNVMKQGHICLSSFNVTKCLSVLPRFMTICASDIWKSNNLQIASGVYHTVKELIEICIALGLKTAANVNLHRKPITHIITDLGKCLNEPFGFVSQQIIGVFQTIFEVCGREFIDILQPALNEIGSRYDDTATKQIQIENAVRAAISTMGPESALIAVPLTDANGNVNISRLWLLQALKKSICGSSLDFFRHKILPLADLCRDQWKYHQKEGNLAAARTSELFYIQLWDLFPSFCDQPKDLKNFAYIAKIVGDALKNHVEIRTAIFDGLVKLLQNPNDESKIQLTRFSRNYLNILLNIFTKKPHGSEEYSSHENALKLIVEYLKITPSDVLTEIFNSIRYEYKSKERVETVLQKVQELNRTLDRREENELQIGSSEAEKIQDEYKLLKNIIQENAMGIEYVEENVDEVVELLKIIPEKRVQQLFKGTQQFIGVFTYQAYFELLTILAAYQSADNLNELFTEYIEPTLRNAKKGGVTQLIKERQTKSYELLRNILKSDNAGAKQFVKENMLQIQKSLLNTIQNRKNTSQDVRLSCLLLLIEKDETRLQYNSKLISRTIPEIVMCFQSSGKKSKDDVALNLLLKIGNIYQQSNKLADFMDILMAGLDTEADDAVISNTVQVLQAILQHFTEHLSLNCLNSILEQVLAQLITGSRQKVKAAIEFVMSFIKILPASFVANHLPNIVKTLSAMKPDTKRFYRKQLGLIYNRLCKRFTPEEIIKLVPGNDEITHKKLKNIRKALSRTKRQKLVEKHESDDDDGLGGEVNDPEDILADSDSNEELEEDILADLNGKASRLTKKAGSKEEKYLYEGPDSIVDLADGMKAMGSIGSTKPQTTGQPIGEKKKAKDPNRGFKTDISGKLIIEEPKRGDKDNDTESDEDMDEGNADIKGNPMVDSDSDDETTENARAKMRKRKTSSSLSQVSGMSGASSKYLSRGKGIHRPLTGAESVRSGYTNISSETNATGKSTAYGSEYRSKKSKGDIKKKGAVDPYAYIPLSRNTLNKRKRAKNIGHFKNYFVQSQKGTATDSKRRKV